MDEYMIFWLIGALFTIGMVDRELERDGEAMTFMKSLAITIYWPYMLGTLIVDLMRGEIKKD